MSGRPPKIHRLDADVDLRAIAREATSWPAAFRMLMAAHHVPPGGTISWPGLVDQAGRLRIEWARQGKDFLGKYSPRSDRKKGK